VANRQPRRLLVSIGANNGLWEMGFEAAASGGVVGQPAGVLDARDMADLAMLVGKLKALPPGVEHIYINTLPLPSAVANTMPVPDTSDGHQPGPGAYYRTYENRFGFNYAQLSAAQVGENDLVVKAVNQKLADLVGAGGRIHLVPIDATFQQCDFKTNAEASTVSVGGKVLTNVMTEGPELLFPRYWRGGLIGLDGMHPTIVGYALMAQTILASIEEHEAIVAARPLTLDDAYNADSLLQKVPLSWDVVLDLSLDIRGAGAARLPRPTGPKYDAIASLLGALACKVD
jgi:lysophospholipase L1-like esterase